MGSLTSLASTWRSISCLRAARRVVDDELQALSRTGRGLRDAGPDRDRARRAGRSQLDEADLVTDAVVVVRVEADLLDVERLGRIDVDTGTATSSSFQSILRLLWGVRRSTLPAKECRRPCRFLSSSFDACETPNRGASNAFHDPGQGDRPVRGRRDAEPGAARADAPLHESASAAGAGCCWRSSSTVGAAPG